MLKTDRDDIYTLRRAVKESIKKPKDYEISGNKIVLKYLFFFCLISGGSFDMRQTFWNLISMFGFREGDSHIPTSKPALMFSWAETLKRPIALYVYRKQQK